MNKQVKNVPYSEEQYAKIGKLTATIDMRIKTIEMQIKQHEKTTSNFEGKEFSEENKLLFKNLIGIDLENLVDTAKKGIEDLKSQLFRLEDVRERIIENNDILLATSEFFDLIYQPQQNQR